MRPKSSSYKPVHSEQLLPSRRLTDIITIALSVLLLVLLLMIAAGIYEVRDMIRALNQSCALAERHEGFQLPTKLILNEPECANRLLEAMGIDNVHVVTESDLNMSISKES